MATVLEAIDEQIGKLNQAKNILMETNSVIPEPAVRRLYTRRAVAAPKPERTGLSAEGRKKLSESMKARWAARQAASAPAPNAPKKRGRPRLSPVAAEAKANLLKKLKA